MLLHIFVLYHIIILKLWTSKVHTWNKNRKRLQRLLYSIPNSHNKHVTRKIQYYKYQKKKKQSTPCTGDNLISESKNPFNTTIFKSTIELLI